MSALDPRAAFLAAREALIAARQLDAGLAQELFDALGEGDLGRCIGLTAKLKALTDRQPVTACNGSGEPEPEPPRELWRMPGQKALVNPGGRRWVSRPVVVDTSAPEDTVVLDLRWRHSGEDGWRWVGD